MYNCKKKTLENQTDLTKTAVDFAQLDHRADIRKAETSRIPKTQGSARKHDTSLPSKKKSKPRSCSPSVNNENIVHLNLIHNEGRIAQSVRASCKYRECRQFEHLYCENVLSGSKFHSLQKKTEEEGHFNIAKTP